MKKKLGRNMLKISTRLTLWYLTATGLIIIITAVAMYYIYEEQRRQAIDIDLMDYADFLTYGLGDKTSDLSQMFDELVKRKDKPSIKQRTHRFVLASNDSVIFESNVQLNLDSLLGELEERNEFSFTSIFNTVKLNDNEYRTYTRPIKISSKKDFKLILFTSLDRLYESLEQLRLILLIIIPISLFAAGLIGFFIARRAFAPVRAITETAAAISSQNLEQRVPVGKSEDEISKLAKTFNEMIQRLYDIFQSQQRFIADASHDLRTPITVIQTELELLDSKPGLDENTKQTIGRSLIEIDRLKELAENLMILARSDAHQLLLNKKIFRLDELLVECLSQLNNLAKSKDISFILNINDPIEISADESLIRRAIINILDNALKYSYENTKIDISMKSDSDKAIININNKGAVIPPEMLVKIFNRFQRGDISRTSKGFGLGLAIVKAITETHEGNVALESDETTGTTCRISFPL